MEIRCSGEMEAIAKGREISSSMGGKKSPNPSVTWSALNIAGPFSIRPRGRRKVEETHCCISEGE
jgi:hypothetical protein